VEGSGSLWGLGGSASIKDKTLTLTVTNPHVSETREAEIVVRGATVASLRADVLRAPEIHAVNTFESPKTIVPQQDKAEPPKGAAAVHRFPPASVTRLTMTLA
jgi:alpha-N-arabinofuranosidase